MNKDETLDFESFVGALRALDLHAEETASSAHHSNGSGRDWEALQSELGARKKD